LRDAAATVTPVKIHAPKLRAIVAAGFDPEHADDLVVYFDDPEGVTLGFGEYVAQYAHLSVDGRLNVLLESLAHLGRSELPIDPGEEVDNLSVVGVLVSANESGLSDVTPKCPARPVYASYNCFNKGNNSDFLKSDPKRCRSRPPASLGEARFDDLIHGIVVQADDLGGDG